MLLLVVAAGFVFLFQSELRFRDNLRELTAQTDELRQAQADTELQLAAVEATRDATEAALSAAESGNRELEEQLVESQATAEALSVAVDTLTGDLNSLKEDLAEIESEAQSRQPVVRIVTPADGATLPAGSEVSIVVVAMDPSGLTDVEVSMDGDTLSSHTVDGEPLFARTIRWTAPDEEDEHTITLSAVNLNGLDSDVASVTFELVDIESRNAETRAEIEDNVIELRGLDLLEPIVPVTLNRDELRRRIEADFAEDNSPEEARADVLELAAFDFLDRDYDLYNALIDLQSEGILGFYDPETAEFVVVTEGELLDPSAQWTHAHEVVHALQDQYYDLDRIQDESLDSEARFALRAIAEGEAELVQLLYLFEGDYFTPEEANAIISENEEADVSYLDDFPPVLISNLSFPYTAGFEFVLGLYQDGGFEAIDAVWQNPPLSTEHILHPERYAAGDLPQIVTLAPLTDTLGVGWELVEEEILGEFFLREYLAQQLSESAVDEAASGWGGDHYAVYWNEADEALVLALQLVWDTPADAAEFAEAFRAYPAALLGVEGSTQPDGSECWPGAEVICFADVDGVSFIVRAPDLTTAAAVMNAVRP